MTGTDHEKRDFAAAEASVTLKAVSYPRRPEMIRTIVLAGAAAAFATGASACEFKKMVKVDSTTVASVSQSTPVTAEQAAPETPVVAQGQSADGTTAVE